MKEGIVSKGPTVKIVDSPIPTPNADQVVIKVVFSGSNPKDWFVYSRDEVNWTALTRHRKVPQWTGKDLNQGDDIAGYVHAVGDNVYEFKVGDRVAAFHEMMTPHGSYAEYALAWAHTTFHLPKNTSFEEAATLPLATMTSALGLYYDLDLPTPFRPATEPIPLLVYGGASAVGAYAIQFAQRSNIHPIIAVAGRGVPYVESLLDKSKGDAVVDYRNGDDAVVQGIKDALKGQTLNYAYDAVSENGSYVNVSKALEPNGKITLVLPGRDYPEIPANINKTITTVGAVHNKAKEFGFAYYRLVAQGLKEGWFKPHPYEIIPGGIGGVQTGLSNLKDGKASATKYIFKIAETEGAEKSSL